MRGYGEYEAEKNQIRLLGRKVEKQTAPKHH